MNVFDPTSYKNKICPCLKISAFNCPKVCVWLFLGLRGPFWSGFGPNLFSVNERVWWLLLMVGLDSDGGYCR